LISLSRQNALGVRERIEQELLRDGGERGRKLSATAFAAGTDPENKKSWMTKVSEPNAASQLPQAQNAELSWAELRASMTSIQSGPISAREPLTQAYFEALPKLAREADEDYLENYTKLLYPSQCSKEVSERTDSFIESHGELPEIIQRSLKILSFEESRCSRILNET
jgi:hypothetical protein